MPLSFTPSTYRRFLAVEKLKKSSANSLSLGSLTRLSADYLSDLKIKFRLFSQPFGERMIADIAPKEISSWLQGLSVGAVSRNTIRSRLATLFSFAKRQGYTPKNPMADVERSKRAEWGNRIQGLRTAGRSRRCD